MSKFNKSQIVNRINTGQVAPLQKFASLIFMQSSMSSSKLKEKAEKSNSDELSRKILGGFK